MCFSHRPTPCRGRPPWLPRPRTSRGGAECRPRRDTARRRSTGQRPGPTPCPVWLLRNRPAGNRPGGRPLRYGSAGSCPVHMPVQAWPDEQRNTSGQLPARGAWPSCAASAWWRATRARACGDPGFRLVGARVRRTAPTRPAPAPSDTPPCRTRNPVVVRRFRCGLAHRTIRAGNRTSAPCPGEPDARAHPAAIFAEAPRAEVEPDPVRHEIAGRLCSPGPQQRDEPTVPAVKAEDLLVQEHPVDHEVVAAGGIGPAGQRVHVPSVASAPARAMCFIGFQTSNRMMNEPTNPNQNGAR